jgi:hypothetical protein
MEALEICLVPKEPELKYILNLWKNQDVFFRSP